MAILKRDSGSIFYSVQGEGPALLMLRGLGRSSRYWLGFDKVMAYHFKVVTIDQRGVGRSDQAMAWTDDWETLARDTLAVMDQLDLTNFHIFGLSLGGMIGARLAALVPDRILSLAIAASSSADYRSLRLHPLALPKLLLALKAGRFQDKLLELVVPKMVLHEHGDEIQAAWQEIIAEEGFPLLTTLKQLRLSISHRINKTLDLGNYPVIFIHGSRDAFVPIQNSRHLHRLVERSQLKIIQGAGHEISLGFERELAQVLLDFTEGYL